MPPNHLANLKKLFPPPPCQILALPLFHNHKNRNICPNLWVMGDQKHVKHVKHQKLKSNKLPPQIDSTGKRPKPSARTGITTHVFITVKLYHGYTSTY